MLKDSIQLKVSEDDTDVAYVYLPDHPKGIVFGLVKSQIRLQDLIEGYKGPDIYLDFNKEDVLVGIEIT